MVEEREEEEEVDGAGGVVEVRDCESDESQTLTCDDHRRIRQSRGKLGGSPQTTDSPPRSHSPTTCAQPKSDDNYSTRHTLPLATHTAEVSDWACRARRSSLRSRWSYRQSRMSGVSRAGRGRRVGCRRLRRRCRGRGRGGSWRRRRSGRCICAKRSQVFASVERAKGTHCPTQAAKSGIADGIDWTSGVWSVGGMPRTRKLRAPPA